ncbi:cytochrome d ubiquinol oxidase subunit II [Streptomyces bauhiniae]|uniref:cytochrome d ubiquinol oxidase subunit II n=1 Tax=Streptomyces bauhiniae TaxID=2340725 RepID=UPI0035D85954
MVEYAAYALILFALGAYVILDGYDLGIGILSLFDRNDQRRKEYNELIATAWDANESWIILAGVGLWAAMPAVYATVLPGLYLPLIVMLLAIVLRGMSIEFQSAASDYRRGWGALFGAASLVATLCQGLVVGGVLSGMTSRNGVFHGGPLDWLTPYSVLTALGLTLVYALAGAAWLQDKTEGIAHRRAGRQGRPLILATVLACVVLGFGLHLADPQQLRFDQPLRTALCAAAVAVAAACAGTAWYGFGRRPDWRPFVAVLVMEAAGLLALVAATAPVVVPPGLTLQEASSPHSSQLFVLIGIGGCMPVVLTYNIYAWWVFRGKATVPPEAAPEPVRPVPPGTRPSAPAAERTDGHPVVTVVRRAGLVVLGVGVAAVAQDVFGSKGEWIGPVGITAVSLAALAAWLWSDRRAMAAGEFGPEPERTEGPVT